MKNIIRLSYYLLAFVEVCINQADAAILTMLFLIHLELMILNKNSNIKIGNKHIFTARTITDMSLEEFKKNEKAILKQLKEGLIK